MKTQKPSTVELDVTVAKVKLSKSISCPGCHHWFRKQIHYLATPLLLISSSSVDNWGFTWPGSEAGTVLSHGARQRVQGHLQAALKLTGLSFKIGSP